MPCLGWVIKHMLCCYEINLPRLRSNEHSSADDGERPFCANSNDSSQADSCLTKVIGPRLRRGIWSCRNRRCLRSCQWAREQEKRSQNQFVHERTSDQPAQETQVTRWPTGFLVSQYYSIWANHQPVSFWRETFSRHPASCLQF
jgi:hypothetical protein